MRRSYVFLLVFLLHGIGCDSASTSVTVNSTKQSLAEKKTEVSSSTETASTNTIFKPFHIYKDKGYRFNHFIPSGFMPNGKCLQFTDRWVDDCQDGKTCIKIVYDTECSMQDQNWSGIYWLNPPNNWGTRKGGFNLEGATKITFWAKGDSGGERIEEFKIGGIAGDYPDSDMAMIGPVILKDEWRQYTIDLRGKDLSYISGGFSWATNVDVNPDGCTFYLDDIKYE